MVPYGYLHEVKKNAIKSSALSVRVLATLCTMLSTANIVVKQNGSLVIRFLPHTTAALNPDPVLPQRGCGS